jgi:hypothetical protein
LKTYEKSKSMLPSFITFTEGAYQIKPLTSDKPGKYTILIDLSDPFDATISYSFDISVTSIISYASKNSDKKATKNKITEVKAKIKIESISKTGLITIKL